MSSSPRSRITRAKRACDGCQIRKVKCDGGQPCLSCANTKIACTFSRAVHTRGPRRMRETTRNIIERIQREERQQSSVDYGNISLDGKSTRGPVDAGSIRHGTWKRIPLSILSPQLYIYHLKLFPVWPVVNVDTVIAELQQGDQDSHDTLEAYALAISIAGATVAQLRLDRKAGENRCILRASDMAYECEKVCSLIRYKNRVNLNTIRISFFLHIYYENQEPGCGESLLHLRDSISVAQLMSLHQETSYTGRVTEEQNLRRLILWLLFVTERGVCLLHKLPVIIKTNIALPSMSLHDGQFVLPAFIQLINLFLNFEQAGLFDVIGYGDDADFSSVVRAPSILDSQTVESLHRKLHEAAKEQISVSDVQKVDIYITQHWMKMILWRLRSPSSSSSNDLSIAFPLSVASDFLDSVARLPTSAIEAHGLTIQLKIVEIASSVVDSISYLATLPVALPNWTNDLSPARILTHLNSLMSSFRHRAGKNLIEVLCQKTAEVHARMGYCAPLSSRPILDDNSNLNQTPLDADDATTYRRQNVLVFPTFDDVLTSIETSLDLSSANELPYEYSDQYRNDIGSLGIDSPGELATPIFDHHIGQNTMCDEIPGFAFNPVVSLLMGNDEASISTSAPLTTNDYERGNETPSERLF
ncbi:hypothetical protein EYB25_006398 [Talaromyces marneffei]|nr:hypothetical protein EYB25_006398 [Talaromyces marneffei]